MNTVVFSIDKQMVMPLAVTLTSMDGRCHNLEAVVLSLGLTDSQKAGLRAASPMPVEFIEIDEVVPRHFPRVMWLTRAAYGRMWIADLVDKSKNRVVYLDADLLIREPLDYLFAVDLEGCAIGACEAVLPIKKLKSDWERLGLDLQTRYMNTGVMVFDLDEYRKQGIKERAITFINDNLSHLKLADQDAINYAVMGNFKAIPPRWNQEAVSRVIRPPLDHRTYSPGEMLEMIENPAIIHYSGTSKPWNSVIVDKGTSKMSKFYNMDPATDLWFATYERMIAKTQSK